MKNVFKKFIIFSSLAEFFQEFADNHFWGLATVIFTYIAEILPHFGGNLCIIGEFKGIFFFLKSGICFQCELATLPGIEDRINSDRMRSQETRDEVLEFLSDQKGNRKMYLLEELDQKFRITRILYKAEVCHREG
jgi:hypothetical protein